MTIKYVIISVIGIAIAALISALCVTLLPSPYTSDNSRYEFKVSYDGNVTWYDVNTGEEKLMISSQVLKLLNGNLNTEMPSNLSCGQISATIHELMEPTRENIQCWTVHSRKGGTTDCNNEQSLIAVTDCISMTTTYGDTVYWFGGAEMVSQKWPINSISLEKTTAFLSSDLPKRYGNVLERYYLSSKGAAIYVYPDVPLHVSMLKDRNICLQASYDSSQLIGPTYLKPDDPSKGTELKYAVCIGESAKDVHSLMTDPERGFIKRPKKLPDLKMMKEPIWSTWARFKASINQTIVEQFADEILLHNFTNSQLEIDDGYEKYYGDFTFDVAKFPDAKSLVDKLHRKGFRVTTWVTPFINLNSANYLAARKQRFFVPDSDGSPGVVRWWNGRGSVVDFTNSEAASWYQNLLADVKMTYGVDSFKFDAGETSYLPKSGLNFTAIRSPNPGDFTTAYADAAFQIGGDMAEMRSSWKTQDKNFYMRLMDKGSSWGSLRGFQTLIPSSLTFSILGYPYVLPDMIGGNVYVFGRNNSNLPDRELYVRWIELGAFLPSMQFSISPWQYDERVTEIARTYVELHRTVVYDEMVKAAERYLAGEMSLLVAPVWFHATSDDVVAFSLDDEFLVGDRYLVAPIVEQGATQRDVYLPGDRSVKWKDKMRSECVADQQAEGCVIYGGTWVKSYAVPLEKISWWEKLSE